MGIYDEGLQKYVPEAVKAKLREYKAQQAMKIESQAEIKQAYGEARQKFELQHAKARAKADVLKKNPIERYNKFVAPKPKYAKQGKTKIRYYRQTIQQPQQAPMGSALSFGNFSQPPLGIGSQPVVKKEKNKYMLKFG